MTSSSLVFILIISSACRRYRDDLDYSHNVLQQWSDEELVSGELYQFEGVRYSLDDVETLRHQITNKSIVANRRVLDLDCETGILSLLSSQHEAKYVISTAHSPAANACARYNLALQQAALADAGCPVEIRHAKASDIVAAADPFDTIFVALDPQNTDRLLEFLDAMRDGLATGGRGWIGNPDSASRFDWETELAARGLEEHTPAPEPQKAGDGSETDAAPAPTPASPKGKVLTLKLVRGADVKQKTGTAK